MINLRAKTILAATAIVLVASGCATLGRGPTDAELVAATMDQWRTGFESADLDGMLRCYSEDFQGERVSGKEELGEFLKRVIDEGYLDNAKADLESAKTVIEDGTATVSSVEIGGISGNMSLKFDLKQEDDGVWRIVASGRQ